MGGYSRPTITSLKIITRDASDRDLPAILKLELASFSDPWTKGMFSSHLDGNENVFLVAELILSEHDAADGDRNSRGVHAGDRTGDAAVVMSSLAPRGKQSRERQLLVQEREIVGFAVARTAAGEAELLNIAVWQEKRGLGIGNALLDQIISRIAEKGAESMYLEVRESNNAARAMYAGRQFVEVGRRKRYYRHPTEDGLILQAKIPVFTGNPVK